MTYSVAITPQQRPWHCSLSLSLSHSLDTHRELVGAGAEERVLGVDAVLAQHFDDHHFQLLLELDLGLFQRTKKKTNQSKPGAGPMRFILIGPTTRTLVRPETNY